MAEDRTFPEVRGSKAATKAPGRARGSRGAAPGPGAATRPGRAAARAAWASRRHRRRHPCSAGASVRRGRLPGRALHGPCCLCGHKDTSIRHVVAGCALLSRGPPPRPPSQPPSPCARSSSLSSSSPSTHAAPPRRRAASRRRPRRRRSSPSRCRRLPGAFGPLPSAARGPARPALLLLPSSAPCSPSPRRERRPPSASP